MKTNKKISKHVKNQMAYGKKKLGSQMDELEKEFLIRQFFKVDRDVWEFTDYSWDRFVKREIHPPHFLSIWKKSGGFELVEFHLKQNSNRILLRSKEVHNGAQVCVVFNITDKKIITVYTNRKDNKHDKLKREFYDASLDVLKTYEEVKR